MATISVEVKEVDYIDKNYKKITSLYDAIQTKDLSPTPAELAQKIKNGYIVKYIILKKVKNKYKIREGRLRFWANVIAFGWNKKIKFILDE